MKEAAEHVLAVYFHLGDSNTKLGLDFGRRYVRSHYAPTRKSFPNMGEW